MITVATLQRLVEGLGTGARADEKGGVNGRDEDGTSERSLLSCALRHRLSRIRCSSPKYCKNIVGSTADTTLLQTQHDTQPETAIL
jgi:hypothetical protein